MTSSAIFHQWDFKLPVTGMAINRNGDWLAVALGDGSLRLIPAHEGAKNARELKLHDGVSLSLKADADGQGFISGGDDGKVQLIDPVMAAPTTLAEHKGKWIDHVETSATGDFRAYAIGKTVYLLDKDGNALGAPMVHPSSAGGLSFSPNGKRLAVSHYNGLSLWWTQAKDQTPVKLPWKGSHLDVIWTPDGKIVLTSMQDAALHGWRLSDTNEMRMQGYANKIRSFGFTPRGRYLATSGADQVICWPFFGGGPWGKTPLMLGGREIRLVTAVAPHSRDDLVAAGYDDGMMMLSPLDGRMEIMIHQQQTVIDRNKPATATGFDVVGMNWNGAGDCLFAALANGRVMLFTIDSVKHAVQP